ncbi:MAG: RNA polymerase sigma factor [Terrisporobacter sp.]
MNTGEIEKFYSLYSKDVYLYTFSLCKNEHLSEDIMQEAFVKGILSLDDNHENVKAWLFMVCRNLWIDYIRKNKKLSNLDINEIDIEDSSSDILKNLIRSEESLNLYNQIITLPQAMKEAVILYYYLEIPQQKIAEIMNISNGSVRTLIYRARKNLKSKVEG